VKIQIVGEMASGKNNPQKSTAKLRCFVNASRILNYDGLLIN
jgi:hypothetical protein